MRLTPAEIRDIAEQVTTALEPVLNEMRTLTARIEATAPLLLRASADVAARRQAEELVARMDKRGRRNNRRGGGSGLVIGQVAGRSFVIDGTR